MALLDIILIIIIILLIIPLVILAIAYSRKTCTTTTTPGPTGYPSFYCDPSSKKCIVTDPIPTGWNGFDIPYNDIPGGNPIKGTGATGFQECMQYCLQTPNCVAVAYDTKYNLCYRKSAFGTPQNTSNRIAATVITPSSVIL